MSPLVVGTVGSLIAAAIWAALFPAGRRLVRGIWNSAHAIPRKVPGETIRITARPGHWADATLDDGQPATHLVVDCNVANIVDRDVHVLSARLARYRTKDVSISTRSPNRDIFGHYPILAGELSEVIVEFVLFPAVDKRGSELKATMFLIDQFGNEHRVRAVFRRPPSAD